MFTRRGRCKTLVAQAVVCLLVVFLSVNLLTAQTVSGEDAVVDNRIGAPGDGRNAGHEGRLSPDRSIPDLLRQRMEKRSGSIRGQGGDVYSFIEGKDKKAGRYKAEAPNQPLSKATGAGKRPNTGLLTWNTEEVDAPKYFGWLSSRAIAVDASGHPHVVYGGDHLYHAYHDGTSWYYETVDSSSNVGWDAVITVDTSGNMHISYVGENHTLKYTTNTSGTWVMTTVDSDGGWAGIPLWRWTQQARRTSAILTRRTCPSSIPPMHQAHGQILSWGQAAITPWRSILRTECISVISTRLPTTSCIQPLPIIPAAITRPVRDSLIVVRNFRVGTRGTGSLRGFAHNSLAGRLEAATSNPHSSPDTPVGGCAL